MTTKEKIFLVTGATGKQGGATVRHLLKAGAKVRALTRKPDSKKAIELRNLGVEIVKGNLNDINSLEGAVNGVHGIFAVTNYFEAGTRKKEVLQNKNLVDLAKKYGIQHYVYASIGQCDNNPGIPHFITKYEAEQYIKSSGLPYTILRAVYFMDNLIPAEQSAPVHWAYLPDTLGEKSTLQLIATDDIGWFAANALLKPEGHENVTIDIAGDELTYNQILEAYKKTFGVVPKKSAVMKFIITLIIPEIKTMFKWLRNPVFMADIKQLRKIHPGLLSIESYFQQVKTTL